MSPVSASTTEELVAKAPSAPTQAATNRVSMGRAITTPRMAQASGSGDPFNDPANNLLADQLALASQEFDATARDPERNCWLVVHRHIHGVLPSEYDIREVPEELYLAVLKARRRLAG